MDTFLSLSLGLIAAFMLANGLGFWFQIDTMNELFALSTLNDLGFASIRADFGGFFLAVGTFSAYAAWKRFALAALAGAVLLYVALVGRFLSLWFDGVVDGGVPPMIFEFVAGSILLLAYNRWRTAV